jgi:hypothetical protein
MITPELAKVTKHFVETFNPMKRLGKPEEVANVVLFLCEIPAIMLVSTIKANLSPGSRRASFVCGASYIVRNPLFFITSQCLTEQSARWMEDILRCDHTFKQNTIHSNLNPKPSQGEKLNLSKNPYIVYSNRTVTGSMSQKHDTQYIRTQNPSKAEDPSFLIKICHSLFPEGVWGSTYTRHAEE